MSQVKVTAGALVSPRWRWVTLGVILLMLVLARLGVWQLERHGERRAQNVELEAALAAEPLNLNAAGALGATLSEQQIAQVTDRDATATGRYDLANQIVVKLQTFNGETGVRLVTPLLLDGLDSAVLVDRGWVSEADAQAGNFYADQLDGPITVSGYLAPPEIISRLGAGSSVPSGPLNEVFRVDIAGIQQVLPYPVAPMYLREAPQGELLDTLPYRTAKAVDLSEGPHLSYAIQWFIFSLGLGVAYLVFVNYKLRTEGKTPVPVEADTSKPSMTA